MNSKATKKEHEIILINIEVFENICVIWLLKNNSINENEFFNF